MKQVLVVLLLTTGGLAMAEFEKRTETEALLLGWQDFRNHYGHGLTAEGLAVMDRAGQIEGDRLAESLTIRDETVLTICAEFGAEHSVSSALSVVGALRSPHVMAARRYRLLSLSLSDRDFEYFENSILAKFKPSHSIIGPGVVVAEREAALIEDFENGMQFVEKACTRIRSLTGSRYVYKKEVQKTGNTGTITFQLIKE